MKRNIVKKENSLKNQWKNFYCIYKIVIWSSFIAFVVPFLLAWIFKLIEHGLGFINYPDILNYCALIFGLLVSITTYVTEQNRSREEKLNKTKHQMMLSLELADENEYSLIIKNCGKEPLTNIFLNGEFLVGYIEDKYFLSINTLENENGYCHIRSDEKNFYLKAVDDDGLPDIIDICIDDDIGNIWLFNFHKRNAQGIIYYDIDRKDKPYIAIYNDET